jgi:integrase
MANLTAQQIKEIDRPGKYSDGRGLLLVVSPAGTKSWAQRITVDGKRIDRGLGSFPKVSLSRAREIADRNRAAVKQGRNPWTEKPPAVTVSKTPAAVPTFREAAQTVHDLNVDEWDAATAKRWIRRLELHAMPTFGDARIDEITRSEIAAMLGPLRRRNHETARKVRQAMTKLFRWAVAHEYRPNNPADDALEELLPQVAPDVVHRPALHHSAVRGALHKIRHSEAKPVTRLAFEYLILTAARTGEVRFATWGEIDLQAGLWTIPAARMKGKRDHRVPLSMQAQSLLTRARELYRNPDDDYDWPVTVTPDTLIFPHPTSGRALSENALLDRARKSNLGCVPHGFRSTWRDWAAEKSGASWETIELSLAHAVGSTVSAAYFRTDLLDARTPMMQAWADYVDPPIF